MDEELFDRDDVDTTVGERRYVALNAPRPGFRVNEARASPHAPAVSDVWRMRDTSWLRTTPMLIMVAAL
jgi:hypothetical protein